MLPSLVGGELKTGCPTDAQPARSPPYPSLSLSLSLCLIVSSVLAVLSVAYFLFNRTIKQTTTTQNHCPSLSFTFCLHVTSPCPPADTRTYTWGCVVVASSPCVFEWSCIIIITIILVTRDTYYYYDDDVDDSAPFPFYFLSPSPHNVVWCIVSSHYTPSSSMQCAAEAPAT